MNNKPQIDSRDFLQDIEDYCELPAFFAYWQVATDVIGVNQSSLKNCISQIDSGIDSLSDFLQEYDKVASSCSINKMGYKNPQGEWLIPAQFDEAFTFIYQCARVMKGQKYGFIDSAGQEVIPYIYEDVGDFAKNGLAKVSKNGKYGFINIIGQEIIPIIYQGARDFAENEFVLVRRNDTYGFIDCNNQELTPFISNAGDLNDNYYDNLYRYIVYSKNGKQFEVIAHQGYIKILRNYLEENPYRNRIWIMFRPDTFNEATLGLLESLLGFGFDEIDQDRTIKGEFTPYVLNMHNLSVCTKIERVKYYIERLYALQENGKELDFKSRKN